MKVVVECDGEVRWATDRNAAAWKASTACAVACGPAVQAAFGVKHEYVGLAGVAVAARAWLSFAERDIDAGAEHAVCLVTEDKKLRATLRSSFAVVE